jgi:hypothetical protein
MHVGDDEFGGMMYIGGNGPKKVTHTGCEDDEWDDEEVELPEIVLGITKVDVALTRVMTTSQADVPPSWRPPS